MRSPNPEIDMTHRHPRHRAPMLALVATCLLHAPAFAALTGAWTEEGGRDEGVFGSDVHTAGDVNGDGYDDVIIAAPGVSGAQGEVSVYYGSPAGVVSPAAWTMTGTTLHYGSHVSTAGDIDGDGYDDVLIGTESYANGEQGEGQVQLFLGSATGLAMTPVWSYESDDVLAHLGPVAYAGDVNADGLADFLMSAPAYLSGRGRVWLYYGNASGTPTFAWGIVAGLEERLGYDIATAGDVNGDGRSDIVIGSYFSERIRVGISNTTTVVSLTVINSPSALPTAHFGASVATLGDVDGDGYSDVAVGAPLDGTGELEEGKVYVFRGQAGGVSTTPDWQYESNVADAELGSDVSTAGDVNGDGYADALFGAKYYTNGQNYEGAAYGFYGGAGGLESTPFWVAEGEAHPGLFGSSLSCAGDVNGDGYADIIVGAPAFEETEEFDEGRVGIWHGGPDMPAYMPYVTEADQEQARYGSAVCLGDFDGDGFSEHVVGAPLFDVTAVDQGQVWIYPGGPGAPATVPIGTLTFQPLPDLFGAAVDNAHDVDGDGYDDLIVGAPMTADAGGDRLGAAHLYRGGPGGLTAVASTIWGPETLSSFGESVSWAGDVNADGLSDVIVGAPGVGNDEGAAYVYLGTPSGIGTTPVWSWLGGVDDARFGWDVANIGDVNGDGFGDVIVGAPGHPTGTGSGRAYVFFGDANGISNAAPWIAETGDDDELGYAVAGCDANGDGASDVIIGAPGYDASGVVDVGRYLLYLSDGVTLGAAPELQQNAAQNGARLGSAVAAADFDQDGSDEIIVSAPYADNGQVDEGQVYIVDAETGTLLWAADGNAPLAWHGLAVASRGDVNGDGFPDVVTGSPGLEDPLVEEGAAIVWIGNAGRERNLSPGLARRAIQAFADGSQGIGLLGGNDDSDSVRLTSDVRSPMGRDRARLEVEIKRVGVPFDGTGLVTTAFTDTGVPGPGGSSTSVDVLASGLVTDTRYHWRARHVSRHPYASSPWLSPSGNAWEEMDLRRVGGVVAVTELAPDVGTLRLSSRPLPFTASTTITFELDRATNVRLSIYDVTGRRVEDLLAGSLARGSHAIRWSGNDRTGRPVASGVYYAVLETGEHRETRPLVVAR